MSEIIKCRVRSIVAELPEDIFTVDDVLYKLHYKHWQPSAREMRKYLRDFAAYDPKLKAWVRVA